MKSLLVLMALAIALSVFFKRGAHLYRLVALARPEERFRPVGVRLAMAVKQSVMQFAQFRVKASDYTFAGIIHIMIIAGFFVLLPGELEFILGGLFAGFDFDFLGSPLFHFFLLSQDIFAALVIVAVLLSFFRRLVLKPPQINYHSSAYVILILILVLMLTLVVMNGLRLAEEQAMGAQAGESAWMPVAGLFVTAAGIAGPHPVWFETVWWLHLLVFLYFLNFLLKSKHLHVITAIPANFFKVLPPRLVQVPSIDFESEDEAALGVSKLDQFSWKQLFDGFTCTECGRCTDQCPANATGKALSPRDIVLDIRDHLLEEGPDLLAGRPEKRALIGGVIKESVLWECTTCGACANVCPVGNEHLRDILEMRRYLAMEQGRLPEIMSRAVRSLETRSRPFYGTGFSADDWKEGMAVPVYEAGKTEYLLWLGCAVMYEERAQQIARAMVAILQAGGVSFGVLETPRCTGDPAKQMGNEFLFQELAAQNIADFEEMEIRKIITLCPHCYHSFNNDYTELGGNYEVIPHVLMIQRLLASGSISVQTSASTICYHDPCYLSRHNGLVEEPRAVIASTAALVEMPRNRKGSFCCGAGGGNFWSEEEGERINQARAKQAVDTGADLVATACPFCLVMLTDGMKAFTDEKKIYDIAELVAEQMQR